MTRLLKKKSKPEKGNIRMGEVVRLVSDMTNGDAIIVTDVGQNQMTAARYYKFTQPQLSCNIGWNGNNGFRSSGSNRSQNR